MLYLLGLVLFLLQLHSRPSFAAAAAFSCSLSLIGTSIYPANVTFSDVSLGCVPVPPTNAAATLSLQVHPDLFTLYHQSFSGVNATRLMAPVDSLLRIDSAANVTFDDCQLINVQAWYLKHIIHVPQAPNASLVATFDNLLCDSCNSSEALISHQGGNLAMLNSRFYGLTNTALYSTGSFLALTNSSYQGKQGAAPRQSRLVIDGPNVTITSCNFSDNSASSDGGAILAISPAINISHSHFSNNSGAKGGAVDIRAHLGGIANCTFENNHATFEDGGAVRFRGYEDMYIKQPSNFTVTSSVFLGNEAANSAGAVCAFGVYWLDVSGCTFKSNAGKGILGSPWQGSAVGIDNPHSATSVFLRDSLFTDSIAGASVFLRNVLCVGIINSVFANSSRVGLTILGTVGDDCEDQWSPHESYLFHPKNVTTVATDQDAITDFLAGAQLTNHIFNCTFVNHAVYRPESGVHVRHDTGDAGGAAVHIRGGLISHHLIERSRFEGNRGLHGSGVYVLSSSATVIWRSVFAGNVATGQGGALSSGLNGDIGVMLGNSTFLQNTAFAGGALHGDANTQFIMTSGTQFIGNNASTVGGAVFCDTCRALLLHAGTIIEQSHAGSNGGGIACDTCNSIQLNGVNFHYNQAGYTNGHETGQGNGGAVFLDGTGASLLNMTNCSALGNTATSDGGALSITGGAAVISNSSFISNTAHFYGGAIAYTDLCFSVAGKTPSTYFPWGAAWPKLATLTGNCSTLILTGGAWLHNRAGSAGPVLYSSQIASTFIDCQGRAGPQQSSASASALQQLGLPCQQTSWGFNGKGNETCSDTGCNPELLRYFAFPPATLSVAPPHFMKYVSNGASFLPLSIQALDQAGQPVVPDGETPIQVLVNASIISLFGGGQTNLDPPLLQGQTQATLNTSGMADITGLILNGRPGLYNLTITLPSYAQVRPFNVSVTVRNCIFGEVRQSPTQCVQCSSPQYSLNPTDEACTSSCPQNANCTGGPLVTPLEGFWVSAPGSDSIVACPLDGACKGDRSALQGHLSAYFATVNKLSGQQGVQERSILALSDVSSSDSAASADQFLQAQCSDGYYGPACSLCVRNSTHSFGRTGPVKCHSCRKPVLIVLAYIGSTLLVVLYECYNIQTTIQENVQEVQGAVSLVKTSELLRALTLWLQYTSLLGRINVPAPHSLQWVFNIPSFVFSSLASGTLSTDCLLNTGPTNLAFKRLLVQVAGPGITLVVILAIQLCWWFYERRRSKKVLAAAGSSARMAVGRGELQCRMLVTFLTVLSFYFPTVLTTTLAFFTCYRLDSGVSGAAYPANAKAAWHLGYWYPDMTIPCWQRWHLRHALSVGVPMLVLCILVPLLPLLLLFRQRKYLKSTYVRIRLGFIYQPFVPRLWFWESIELLQTFALALGIALAASINSYYQLTVGLTILVAGFGLLSLLRPYCRAISQRTQVFSLLTVLGTAVGCLYMLNADSSFVASQAGLNAVAVLIVLLNSAFVLIMAVLIGRSSTGKVKSILLWLGHKFMRMSHNLNLCLGCKLPHRGASNNMPSKLSVELHSPGSSCNTSHSGSTRLLVSPITSTSEELDAKVIP